MKFASLCILSFERYWPLKECIASALKHAYADFELIVHDDGSEDPRIREFLLDMQQQGVISTLVMNARGHNEGQGVAMNRMAAIAKGDPIIKCDQDMVLRPGWLKEVNAVLEENLLAGKSHCVHGGCPKPEPCHSSCEDAPPLIGALGIFRYPVAPVRYEDMFIKSRGRYEEHLDFVGSFIAIPRQAWDIFGPWDERKPDFSEDHKFKMTISNEDGWCVALTSDEFGVNEGFGVGKSTIVLDEGGTIQTIKDGPRVYIPDGV